MGLLCFLNSEGKCRLHMMCKGEVISLPSVSLPFTPAACSALAAFQELPGRSQLLGKELQPPLQQKEEALLGPGLSCTAGSSTALLRSCCVMGRSLWNDRELELAR